MLKLAAVTAFMAILGAPTPAELPPVKTGIGTPYYSGPAPARFNKEMAVVVLFVASEDHLYEACGMKRVPGMTLRACTRRLENGTPVIVMPHPAAHPDPSDWFVLQHELGHAAGWPGDHPA